MRFRSRGVEPAIAIPILIVVALVLAIAAAYWLFGSLLPYVGFEGLKILNARSYDGEIELTVKNSGFTTATISLITLNEKLNTSSPGWTMVGGRSSIKPGEVKKIVIHVSSYPAHSLTPGTVYLIGVKTASGGTYFISVRAP